jgi:hypothetical protein
MPSTRQRVQGGLSSAALYSPGGQLFRVEGDQRPESLFLWAAMFNQVKVKNNSDLRYVFQFTFANDTLIWLVDAPHAVLKLAVTLSGSFLVTMHAPPGMSRLWEGSRNTV